MGKRYGLRNPTQDFNFFLKPIEKRFYEEGSCEISAFKWEKNYILNNCTTLERGNSYTWGQKRLCVNEKIFGLWV